MCSMLAEKETGGHFTSIVTYSTPSSTQMVKSYAPDGSEIISDTLSSLDVGSFHSVITNMGLIVFLSVVISLPAPSSVSVVFPGKISAASAFASSRIFAGSAGEAAAATVGATVPLQIVSRPSFAASEETVCVKNSFRI